MCQTLDLNTHLPKPPAPVQEAEKKEQNGEAKVDAKEVSATAATTDKEEEKEKVNWSFTCYSPAVNRWRQLSSNLALIWSIE